MIATTTISLGFTSYNNVQEQQQKVATHGSEESINVSARYSCVAADKTTASDPPSRAHESLASDQVCLEWLIVYSLPPWLLSGSQYRPDKITNETIFASQQNVCECGRCYACVPGHG